MDFLVNFTEINKRYIMKNLCTTKKYDLSQLNDEQLQAVLDWLKENDEDWDDYEFRYFKRDNNLHCLFYDEVRNCWRFKKHRVNLTNALELFNDDNSVYDDMLSLIEKGKQHGLKIVVTFEEL